MKCHLAKSISEHISFQETVFHVADGPTIQSVFNLIDDLFIIYPCMSKMTLRITIPTTLRLCHRDRYVNVNWKTWCPKFLAIVHAGKADQYQTSFFA